MAKGPQQGDRYGVWYLDSRAKPIDGKRYWNVVNTETDETRVIAQTELKNLETDVQANSAQITERVLIGNGKLDAFSAGDGPDDDSEYPFTVEFTEPENVFNFDGVSFEWTDDEDEPAFTDLDATADEGLDECDNCLSACPADENCTIENGKHLVSVPDGLPVATAFKTEPVTESPWDTELRVAIRECMMHMNDARNALDRVLKLVVNQ